MVNSISNLTNRIYDIANNSADDPNAAKAELKELLFETSTYNSGTGTDTATIDAQIAVIENEISNVEKQIENYEKLIENEYKTMINDADQVEGKGSELSAAIAKGMEEQGVAIESSKTAMQAYMRNIQESVIAKYMAGTLDNVDEADPASSIAAEIQARLSGTDSRFAPDFSAANTQFNKSNTIKSAINSLLSKLSASNSTIDGYKTQISTLKSQLSVLNISKSSLEALKSVTSMKGSETNTADLGLGFKQPVYSASKTDFMNELKAQINPAQPQGDKASMENPQLGQLSDALGENSADPNSFLKQMKDAGFTYEEAAYATAWLFDGVSIGYNVETGRMSVPWGHGGAAAATYTNLITQMKDLWDADAVHGPSDEPGIPDPKRTDPIGFNIGDKAYNFVLDTNSDGVFNNKSEFLGAGADISAYLNKELTAEDKLAIQDMFGEDLSTALWGEDLEGLTSEALEAFDLDGNGNIEGMESMFMLDVNNDGKINGDELNNFKVLETDTVTRQNGFMSATMAGVSEIDLSNYMTGGQYDASKVETGNGANTVTDINNNLTQNAFGLTVKGASIEGHQSLESDAYIDNMYSAAFGNAFEVKFDEEAFEESGETEVELIDTASILARATSSSLVSSAEATLALHKAQEKVQDAVTERTQDVNAAQAESWTVAQGIADDLIEKAEEEKEAAEEEKEAEKEEKEDEIK